MKKIIELFTKEKIRCIKNEYAVNSICFWRTDLGKGIDGLAVFKEEKGFVLRYFRTDNDLSDKAWDMYPILFKTSSEKDVVKYVKNLVIPRPEFF